MLTIIYERDTDTFSFGDYKTKSLGDINKYVHRWFPNEEVVYKEVEKGEK